MPSEKDIQDMFNDPKLDGQDWLLPSNSVLDNIQKEIFPTQKKRRIIPFFLFLGVVACIVSVLVFTSVNTNSDSPQESFSSINKEQVEPSVTEQNKIATEEVNIEKYKASNLQTKPANALDQTKKTKLVNNQVTTNKTASAFIESDINSIVQSEIPAQTASLTTNSITSNSTTANNTSSLTQKETNSIGSSSNTNNYAASNTLSINQQLPPVRSDIHGFQSLILLANAPISILDDIKNTPSNERSLPAFAKAKKVEAQNPNMAKWAILAGVTYGQWDFKLNENYLSALEAAAFESHKSDNYKIHLGIQKLLGEKSSIGFNLAYENVNFVSGHNSNVTYDPNAEVDGMENSFDLTMASPIGFLESKITVERAADNMNNQVDLVIDLDNTHQLHSIAAEALWGQQILKLNQWILSSQLGVGVNYIAATKNSLSQFSTNHDDYLANGSEITMDQQNVNAWIPYANIGLNLEWNISPMSSIGTQWNFNKGLKNIFENQTLNSRTNQTHFGVFVKRYIY